MFKPSVKLLTETPIRIPAGGTAKVRIGLMPRTLLAGGKLELRKPGAGIGLEAVADSREGVELLLSAEAGKAKPGLKGSLQIKAVPTKPAKAGKRKAAPWPIPALPPIPFEIVP